MNVMKYLFPLLVRTLFNSHILECISSRILVFLSTFWKRFFSHFGLNADFTFIFICILIKNSYHVETETLKIHNLHVSNGNAIKKKTQSYKQKHHFSYLLYITKFYCKEIWLCFRKNFLSKIYTGFLWLNFEMNFLNIKILK